MNENEIVCEVKQDKSLLGRIRLSIVGFSIILALAIFGSMGLAKLKKEPAKVIITERPLRVEVKSVQPEDIPVTITGYGETRALNVVTISPEISGRIVEIHPRLEVGEVIPSGETLFDIDKRDYEARVAEAGAAVAQLENTVKRLKKQYAIDRERLLTLERSLDLAKAEFDRVKALLKNDKVGTQSGVDQAERAYNTVSDQTRQLAQAVELYPIRILESQNSLASTKARLTLAETSLERTTVKVPCNARIKTVSLEVGQFVSPGVSVLTLADDSLLEISVPLDTRKARQWLRFDGNPSDFDVAWFNDLLKVPCIIRWTEDKVGHVWEGNLHRVEKFDQQSRTITVAVRIAAEAASAANCTLPLVEGMFCQVEIPGRTLSGGFRLPSSVVTFDNTVYISDNGRLKTVPVVVAHIEGQESFISGGLDSGDTVIMTRLVNPLENSLLDMVQQQKSEEIE